MENNKNLRKVKANDEVLSNRRVSYLTYIAMLYVSTPYSTEEDLRRTTFNEIHALEIFRKVHRTTLKRHINLLVKFGFVEYKDDYFYLKNSDKYAMMDTDTISYLFTNTNDDVIRTYAFLLKYDAWLKKKAYLDTVTITFEEITIAIGRTYNKNSDQFIRNIIDLLSKIKLIEFEYHEKFMITKEEFKKDNKIKLIKAYRHIDIK